MSADDPRLADFLAAHPALQQVELVLTDPNGIPRGKWAPVATLKKAFGDGVNFPLSLHGLDIWGSEVAATGLHIESGDRDGFCIAVPETLAALPWSDGELVGADQATTAQVMLETLTPEGDGFGGCSRTVLRRAVQRLAADGLTAVCAVELEFHLLTLEARTGAPFVVAETDAAFDNTHMYDLEALAEKAPVFAAIRRAAAWAGVPIDTVVKEAGPGQYEVNLTHRADPLRAADDAVQLRRIVTEAARQYDIVATFMAKPFPEQPGNGMHVHISLLDEAGQNIFAAEDGPARQRHAVAKLLETMAETTLIFINTWNGFRRMAPGSYAPTRANWGDNNRSVALRLPAAPPAARRIEHRVAGADANPYLLLAILLEGMRQGLQAGNEPPLGLTGNAYDRATPNRGERLPSSMADALELFEGSAFAKRALGGEMHHIICALKAAELATFNAHVSDFERATFV
ncbi:MAG: glutamine synthetase family protein [Pseudomonadota bacterium]